MASTETDETALPSAGGAGTFGMLSVTVLVGSTAVTETENAGGGVAGGGVAAGGGVVAGGSFGAGVDGPGVGAAVLVAELEVAGGDEGAVVDDVVPVAGACVVVGADVVPPVAGGVVVEGVEPDGFDEVFGADTGAAVALPCEARTGLAGTTAATWRLGAPAR